MPQRLRLLLPTERVAGRHIAARLWVRCGIGVVWWLDLDQTLVFPWHYRARDLISRCTLALSATDGACAAARASAASISTSDDAEAVSTRNIAARVADLVGSNSYVR